MHVHFIVHEAFEAPGAIENWARQRADKVTYSRVYLGESLPTSVDTIDSLIVMGGLQSPATTKFECPHFDSKAEQDVILLAINAGKVVIGICLGSQLIGEALGAKVERSPEKKLVNFLLRSPILVKKILYLAISVKC